MSTRELTFEEINYENEAFRISEELDCELILNSIREVGQLNPVLLMEQKGRKVIVCGFRRLRAMKKLGRFHAVASVLPEGCSLLRAFNIALWDNLAHRQLNPLEKARVLFQLRNQFGAEEDSILRDYMPILGLSPAKQVLRSFLLLHEIRPALRVCFADGRLTYNSLDILANKSATAQDRIAFLMGRIRLSASLQKKFFGLLEDLAAATGIQLDGLLTLSDITEVADDVRLSPFQRGEKIYEILYRRRNPRLSQARDHFLDRLKRLQLPTPIRIQAHPFFEEPGLHVEFEAVDSERFRDLASALQRAAHLPDFEDLFLVK